MRIQLKIASLILCLAMVFTLFPMGTFAAEKKAADNSLTSAKNAMTEVIDETYEECVESQSRYSGVIWTLIQKTYNGLMTSLNNETRVGDILVTDGYFYYPSSKYEDGIEKLRILAKYRKNKVKSTKDLNVIKTEYQWKIKRYFARFDKGAYNSFYWDLIQQKKSSAGAAVKKAGSFLSLAGAAVKYPYIYYDEEDEDAEPIELNEEIEGASELTADPDRIYTDDELGVLRAAYEEAYECYIWQIRKDAPKKAVAARKKANEYIVKMGKQQDAMMIADVFERGITAIRKVSGVTLKEANRATKKKLITRLLAAYDTFYNDDYSAENWKEIAGIYESAYDEIISASYEIQLKNSIVTGAVKEMKAVPTLKKETAALKKRYTAKLKKMLKDKQYIPAKIKPVVKNGVAAMKKAYDPTDAEDIYSKYRTKALKCRKSYRIKVVQKGKGTVSKSKTVYYGKSYKVKMEPAKGYRISKLVLDGKKIKARKTYTFKKVTKKHKITVTFSKVKKAAKKPAGKKGQSKKK